jgi:hypothetical protein
MRRKVCYDYMSRACKAMACRWIDYI